MLEDIKEFFRWLFDVPYPTNYKLHPYIIKDGKLDNTVDSDPNYIDYSYNKDEHSSYGYGSRYYDNPGGFGMPANTMDDHGRIYDSPAPFGMPIGSMDSHGRIYDNPGGFGMPTGCIDDHGRIYDTPVPNGMPIGCIDNNGYVYESAAPIGMPIGSIKP